MSDATRRTLRTVVQALIGLAALAPVVAEQFGYAKTGGIVAGVLGVSAVITRVMANPSVDAFLGKFVPWLAKSG